MLAFLFLFFSVCQCVCQKVSWSQAFLAETVETRDRDRNVSQRRALFCRERYVKDIKLFRERDGPRILSLKSVDYFGTSEYFSENFDIEAINWSGVGNLESCDEHAVYFRRWLKWRAMFITFLVSGNNVISLELLVCTWRHGGNVGGQEQKHFSPLGTKYHFHFQFFEKKFYCIDHQHGRLVTWLWTKNWFSCIYTLVLSYRRIRYTVEPLYNDHLDRRKWPS